MPPRRDIFSGHGGILAAGASAPLPPPSGRPEPEDAPPVFPKEEPLDLDNMFLDELINEFERRHCPVADPTILEAYWYFLIYFNLLINII